MIPHRPPLGSFLRDRRGNFSMMLALAMMPILGAVGMAVDYINLGRMRDEMLRATDAAALIAAKMVDATDAERKKAAREIFQANYNGALIGKPKVEIADGKVTVTARAKSSPLIIQILDRGAIKVEVASTATLSKDRLEVVFALDVSGSMRANMKTGKTRMEELKSATKKLIDDLEAAGGFTVAAGYVPFTMNVNVGTNNTSFVDNRNSPLFAGTSWKGCVLEKAPPKHVKDSTGGNWQAYIYPPTPDNVAMGNTSLNPSDGTMAGYDKIEETASASDYYSQYKGPNFNCVRHPLMPLSTDLDEVKKRIDQVNWEYNQGTLIAPGVTWGMRMLSPEAPFTEGSKYTASTHKILIVVTDGQQVTEIEGGFANGITDESTNSVSPWVYDPRDYKLGGAKIETGFGPKDNFTPYGFIMDSSPFTGKAVNTMTDLGNEIRDFTLNACSEVKSKSGGRNIELITIGISDDTKPGTTVYEILNKCASKPSDHFFASDKDAMDKAFSEILKNLKNLRLTS